MSEASNPHWGADALWQQLDALLPGISVEIVAHADSTNTRLLERARRSSGRLDAPVTTPAQLDAAPLPDSRTPLGRRNDDTSPCLLVAQAQTAGRGRAGRIWYASPGTSLTFSLSLPLQPPQWSGLSLAVGVALADALDPGGDGQPPRIGLKWPNDLWLLDAPGDGRKLGGVLIETVAVGERRMAVIGVGLNVRPQTPVPEMRTGFACLQELHAGIDAPEALRRVAAPLARALKTFEREGLTPFVHGYARRDLLRGQRIVTTDPAVPEGVAEGIDAHGALSVRAGQLHVLISGEVSVRPSGA